MQMLAALLALLVAAVPTPVGRRHATHDDPIPHWQPRLGRQRPVIAVLGDNEATETTDYVVPYGILAESNVADVFALSMKPGPIQMRPALRFRVQATIAELDARFPGGADYVIVPNIYDGAEKTEVLAWIREQARDGATIVGICDGVPVLANAGVLEGRQATGHWHTIDSLERKHPGTTWRRNRRYVADGNVITTSGVSASIPVSIALVEAIAGRERAAALATRLGVRSWSAEHDSSRFYFGTKLLTAIANKAMFWRHEELGIKVTPGVDEISLALTADLYSRTFRSQAFAIAPAAVRTKHGLLLIPDRASSKDALAMTTSIDSALDGIRARYGEPTAALVALQIEYPATGILRLASLSTE